MLRRVYLAGSIFGLPDRGQTWREQATTMMPEGWEAVNPNVIEGDQCNPRELITLDYKTIISCQAVIARCRNPSWGTAMELQFAHWMEVPVIGFPFYRPPVFPNYSPWLIHHVSVHVSTLEQAIMELSNV